MNKYDVVIKSNLLELIQTVNEAMKVGYYSKGGLLYVEGQFIQAICIRD